MRVPGENYPAWILTLTFNGSQTDQLNAWLVRLMMAGVDAPGNVNAELMPPAVHDVDDTWSLILRFEDTSSIDVWQNSNFIKNSLSEIEEGISSGKITVSQSKVENYRAPTDVATAIVTHIKPGLEAEYRQWVGEIHTAQTYAPGFRGTFLQAGKPGTRAPWTTLVRFDSTETLDSWLNSQERTTLLDKAKHMLRSDLVLMTSAFPGWFPLDQATGSPPKLWKTAMLVLLVLYPQLIIRSVLPPMFPHLPSVVSLFFSLMISVGLISLVLMPIAVKIFKFWLYPSGHNPRAEEIKGYVILIFLYIAEIALSFLLKNAYPAQPMS